MSPDQWKNNPAIQQLINVSTNLDKALPHLCNYLIKQPNDFRGLTIFLGDTAEYVIGGRRFNDKGEPEVVWSSGPTPLDALINCEKAVLSDRWRLDKPKKPKK